MMPDRKQLIVGAVRRWVGPVMAVLVLALVLTVAWRVVGEYRWDDIAEAMAAIAPLRIALAAAFAAASYFCLSWFDWIALRCVGKPLPWRRAALASFTSLSIGHNVGFAGLSSGAVRYRFYARWGLTFEEVARLVIYCGITVALGLSTVGAISLLLNPSLIAGAAGVGEGIAQVAALLLLVLPVGYLGLAFGGARLSIFKWKVQLPPPRLALAQVAVGSSNYLCVAGCLHALLNERGTIAYLDVAGAYVLANTGVVASHVPGGLGVLESIVLSLLPGASVLAALLMFRVVYYLAPLALGLALLALSEVLLNSRKGWPSQAAKASLQKP
jgi:glycosyltransferase 2 family protein